MTADIILVILRPLPWKHAAGGGNAKGFRIFWGISMTIVAIGGNYKITTTLRCGAPHRRSAIVKHTLDHLWIIKTR